MILVGSYEIDFMIKNENPFKAADNRRLIAYETMRGIFISAEKIFSIREKELCTWLVKCILRRVRR